MILDLEKIRQIVKNLPLNFEEQMQWSIKRNGVLEDTLIYEYKGSQFVFIEGQKNVTLGWSVDDDFSGMIPTLKEEYKERYQYYQQELKDLEEYYAEEIEKAKANKNWGKVEELEADAEDDISCIQEDLEKYENVNAYIEDFKKYVAEVTSAVRVVDIPTMLVEVDSEFLEKDMTWEEVKQSLSETPFRLPTEDEWEYICSGGERIFFKWGNQLSDAILEEMYDIGTPAENEQHDEIQYLQTISNQAAFISYDSYQVELLEQKGMGKGGDGGCSICGGDGAMYVIPCYSCFYQNDVPDRKLSNGYYKIRRVLPITE